MDLRLRHTWEEEDSALSMSRGEPWLEMKKEHPCGARRWEVLRVGMDFRLRCTGCGREVMLPRKKAEKALKKIISPADQAGEDRRNPYAL